MSSSVRIGAGLGFYGDSWKPVRASIERGDVKYIGSDHLSELTLAILAKDRARDASAGYTRDLVPMLLELWPLAQPRGVRFLMNAGGLNPSGAAQALALAFREAGLHARIAVVTGDAMLDRLDQVISPDTPLAHVEHGGSIDSVRSRLLFANAYLGAEPLVRALRGGADIVIAGRVADAALFLAPLVHEFGWSWDDWDRLAAGIAVGHLLECSGQATGGNLGGRSWRRSGDFAHLGFPIAEVAPDGTSMLTKPPGTGGRVDFDTLRQQLLYEVHDPFGYVTPDVVLDMGQIQMREAGKDMVEVTGARGRPKPDQLKLVGGYSDGWLGQIRVGYAWPDAADKARVAADTIRTLALDAGLPVDELQVELLGVDSLMGLPMRKELEAELNEVYLRMAGHFPSRRQADAFARLYTFLGLSGPPFVSGFHGVEQSRELLGIWPALLPRAIVEEHVSIDFVEA